MKSGQFSFRRLLLIVAIIGMLFGIPLALWQAITRAIKRADYEPTVQAIRAGRADLESHREFLAEEMYHKLRDEMAK
jgi:hypothetical protein